MQLRASAKQPAVAGTRQARQAQSLPLMMTAFRLVSVALMVLAAPATSLPTAEGTSPQDLGDNANQDGAATPGAPDVRDINGNPIIPERKAQPGKAKKFGSSWFNKFKTKDGPWKQMGKKAYAGAVDAAATAKNVFGKKHPTAPHGPPKGYFPVNGTADEKKSWIDQRRRQEVGSMEDIGPFPKDGSTVDKQEWHKLRKKFESGEHKKRKGSRGGFFDRLADKGREAVGKVKKGLKQQASKFAHARGEGKGSNTEA